MGILYVLLLGPGLCRAAFRRAHSPRRPAAAADVRRELEGVEAVRPGGGGAAAAAGLSLQGHAGRVLPAAQQTGPAALAPRC